MIAATGARNGASCPTSSVPTSQASAAASAVWAIAGATTRRVSIRDRAPERPRLAASSSRRAARSVVVLRSMARVHHPARAPGLTGP
jgi:hypothetical protein